MTLIRILKLWVRIEKYKDLRLFEQRPITYEDALLT